MVVDIENCLTSQKKKKNKRILHATEALFVHGLITVGEVITNMA